MPERRQYETSLETGSILYFILSKNQCFKMRERQEPGSRAGVNICGVFKYLGLTRKFCLVVKYPVYVNIRRVFLAFLTLFHCLAKYEHAPK